MSTMRLILAGVFGCIAVYLFATAPPALPEAEASAGRDRVVEVERLFNAVNAINHAARAVYTQRIVGAGQGAGLAFGEDWAEPGVEKGPLPALFLRLTAQKMEAKPPPLGLYLGSDEPINISNLFQGAQVVAFEAVKTSRSPVFDVVDQVGHVAMYPDFASVQPCVTCHNEHEDSPKKDWKLDEVMGATTWTYPKGTVGAADYLTVTEAFFQSVEEAYATYLNKAAGFEDPVTASGDWPSERMRVLPDVETFMAEVRRASADQVVSELVFIADAEGVNK